MGKILIGLLLIVVAVYFWNASWLAPLPENPAIQVIAHRGVHQTFNRAGIGNQTCTAKRIFPSTHSFIENTIPSMRAAFEAGADVVEIDVHPTKDGKFAVIHDWTLDCRTDGSGVTREHDMESLKALDVGYGYTADDGRTYPLRGTGVGLMPALSEVLETFPDHRFLINYKSREAREGDMLAAKLAEHPEWRSSIWAVYGGDAPTNRAVSLIDGLKGFGASAVKTCLMRYMALGWTGHVPQACRDTYVMVPLNLRRLMWGWPDRFHARMKSVGSEIILIGPYFGGDSGTSGIDTLDQLEQVPENFNGYVWTNRIEVIGPALAKR
ncbi:glycerophosphodiester phosphodiesterase family protein [Chelativorans sp. YIM 93263]|uniref:glycerophosphodiester phosphodiesterase family protein n=1 Tax=Chelativorans sp. YIM 93263 TaxID=2906648 RepID=UPI0023791715|nr:glycerophosphodiester phosphodiesterase family protein [Chelativorans sp. YIM 93263]